jgi:hypothetical protein
MTDQPTLSVGDTVYPKTKAGLELADVPTNGEYNQKRKTVGVLCGPGVILRRTRVEIDYSTWPDTHEGVGVVAYYNCLVKTKDGCEGWAGDGALVTRPEDQLGSA